MAFFYGGAYAKYEEQDEPGLYLVYPQDERVRCTCDIFVIHGLHGGTTKTWKHPDSGNVWFRDLLPNLIRQQAQGANARIWVYGYPASVTFQAQTIYDFAQALLNRVKDVRKGYENRKIIWICHSMGGVVLKQALIDAKIHARFNSIRDDTAGIIFLGTPHQGSGVANLGAIVASIVSSAMPGVRIFNRDVLKDLKKNNNTLFGISSQFSNICSGITIHSFHETMPLGPNLIVDRTSSIMLLENEVKRYGLNANHREMCRFRDGLDQNWLSVGSSIVELVSLTSGTRNRVGQPNTRRSAANQPGRGLPYPDDPWNSNQPMYPAAQMDKMYAQQNIPRRPIAQPQTAYAQQTQNAPSPNPRDRPTHAPPQLPQGWVAQWDPETNKYFFVELSTGVVQWESPAVGASTAAVENAPRPSTRQAERLDVPQANHHQRSASESSAPARLPYPSVHPAYSRENLSGPGHHSQENLPPRATATSQKSSPVYPHAPTFDTRPSAQTSKTVPVVPTQAPDPDDPSANMDSATCDSCLGPVKCWQPRVQCTVCYDYDLCIPCFQASKETKGHKHTHKVSHILKSQQIMPDDIIPVRESVNPEFNADGTRANWSITETKQENGQTNCHRFIHVYDDNSHARFLASAKPGHYAVSVMLTMSVSGQLSEAGKGQLRQDGAGWLRLSLGTVKNKKEFFGTKIEGEDTFNSNALSKECLPHKLLNHYWWDVISLDIDQQILHVQADDILTIEGEEASNVDMGFILQWSGTRAFQKLSNPIISLAIDHIRMDDLLDYSEPHVRAPPPSTPKPAAVPVQTSPQPEEEPELTDEEALGAFVQLLREAQDAAQREQVRQQMLAQIQQEQEQARQEFLGRLFLQALGEVVGEQQERERQEAERERERQHLLQLQQQQQQQQANQAFVQAFQEAVVEQEMIRYLQSLGLR